MVRPVRQAEVQTTWCISEAGQNANQTNRVHSRCRDGRGVEFVVWITEGDQQESGVTGYSVWGDQTLPSVLWEGAFPDQSPHKMGK